MHLEQKAGIALRRLNASLVYIIYRSLNTFSGVLLFTVVTVYYVTKVGLDPLQLVLIGTVVEATAFLCEVPTGVVADTFSRRRSVIIGVFLEGLAFGLQGVAPDYGLILFCQVLWGIGTTFMSGADTAWLTDEIGEARLGGVLLRASQIGMVASLLGTVSAVGLALVAINLPILVSGAVQILLSLFLLVAMPETGFKPAPREERNSWQSMGRTFSDGLRVVRGKPLLWSILAIGFFMGAASEGFDRLFEAHLLKNFAFPGLGQLQPIVWIGLLSLAQQLVGLVVISLLRKRLEQKLSDPIATARLLLILHSLTIVIVIGYGLAFNFWVAVGLLIIKGILGGLIGPLYDTWLAQNIPSQVRATVISMGNQSNAIGQVAGGPGVGAIGSAFSIRAALVVAGCLLSPALLLYGRVIRGQPSAPTTEEMKG